MKIFRVRHRHPFAHFPALIWGRGKRGQDVECVPRARMRVFASMNVFSLP